MTSNGEDKPPRGSVLGGVLWSLVLYALAFAGSVLALPALGDPIAGLMCGQVTAFLASLALGAWRGSSGRDRTAAGLVAGGVGWLLAGVVLVLLLLWQMARNMTIPW
ncbi:hypothetical protein ACQP1P_22635 [Dactylosporangium sp. CA-052675]|uniref:hypothetical protein n=1 Tax=Dactylosporangium sp. CA-052675 TaxID=3239927 RepID=UPI003D89FBBD